MAGYFSLDTEVVSSDKQKREEEENIFINSSYDGKLNSFESATLSCVLEIASEQLFILDVGVCSSFSSHSNVTLRKVIRDVIEQTAEEIRENGTFEILYDKVKEEIKNQKDSRNLGTALALNEGRIEELKAKLREYNFCKLEEKHKSKEIIAELKDKIHEEIIKSNAQLRYTEKWETAKKSQNRLRCHYVEKELEKKLDEVILNCKSEDRVHLEICSYLNLEEKRLINEMNQWKIKYDKEMEKRNQKIKLLEAKKKEQEIIVRNLWRLYEERKKDIDNYLDFKEKIHREQERNRYINRMATRIQAWWRGTMVRRGLGPFKKKKKLIKEKKKN